MQFCHNDAMPKEARAKEKPMKPTERAKQALAYKLVDYLCDDPENNMANIMGKIDALAPASLFAEQRAAFSDAIKNKTNMYQLIMRVMDLNP